MLVAGERPQMRKASAKNWSKAKEEAFLSVLAETCNVTRACEAAGVGVTSVYRRKKENAAFRAAWLAAISIAYQQLELVLLERAFNGTEKLVKVRAGEALTMREYSNQLGVALLKLHQGAAADAELELPPEETEQFERYGVEISGSAGTFETECDAPKVTIASGDLAGLGGGPATLTVRQIGDWAASHPTQIGITLP